MPLPASDWREWAGTDDFLDCLGERLRRLAPNSVVDSLIADALDDTSWKSIARLDASTRLCSVLYESGAVSRGHSAEKCLHSLCNSEPDNSPIPPKYWSAAALPAQADSQDSTELLLVSGAIITRVTAESEDTTARSSLVEENEDLALAPTLGAIRTPEKSPAKYLWQTLTTDRKHSLPLLGAAITFAAVVTLIEAVSFRGLIDLWRELVLPLHRLAAISLVIALSFSLLLIELPVSLSLQRLGRHLEMKLRVNFLYKLPRLSEQYLNSRLISDMAERVHRVSHIRLLPGLAGEALKVSCLLLFTGAALIWLDPSSYLVVTAALLISSD
jgi:ATP-binding cassette subfamily B protein